MAPITSKHFPIASVYEAFGNHSQGPELFKKIETDLRGQGCVGPILIGLLVENGGLFIAGEGIRQAPPPPPTEPTDEPETPEQAAERHVRENLERQKPGGIKRIVDAVMGNKHGAEPALHDPVYGEIVAARARQDEKWGGRAQDGPHSTEDFVQLIAAQVGSGGDNSIVGNWDAARQDFIEAAALAVAAVQSMDRVAPAAGGPDETTKEEAVSPSPQEGSGPPAAEG